MQNSEVYELTNPQKSIWYTEAYYKGSSIHNICGTANIKEELDFELLKKAILIFMKNNDIFKFKFFMQGDTIKQYISDETNTNIPFYSINSYEELDTIRQKIVSQPFEIFDSFLYNFYIFKMPNNHGAFIVNIHHLLADAWTLGFLSREVIRIYGQLKNNKYDYDEQPIYSYYQYIYSEEKYKNSERFKKDKTYWENEFQTIPEIANIPSIKNNINTENSFFGNRLSYEIDKDIISQIKEYCKNNNISLYNFFMSVYSLYISEISNLDEFVIGTPILNRTNFKEKHAAGMFVTTQPLKINLKDIKDFKEFTEYVAIKTSNMFRHQKYPYQYLLETLRNNNKKVPNLYDILISYQITNTQTTEENINYSAEWTFNGCCSDNLAIHISDLNDTGCLNIDYDYKTSIYEKQDLENLHKRILNIIKQITKMDNILLKDIEIVTEEEKNELINTFNQTKIKYDKNIPIIKYFEKQAEEHPNNIALVFEKSTMTYKELNEKANSLAHFLREKGIKNNTILGIMVERSFEMIIAILATLKSGGAYIPIAPDYPAGRISYMLNDSKANILLIDEAQKGKIKFDGETICISLKNNDIYNKNKENLLNISNPDDLSYLIYTSGSTGDPKGVMLTHKNLTNFYHSMVKNIKYLSFDEKQPKILSITTLSFDIFLFETLISLTSGLKLYITNYYEQKITSKLERLISDNQIEVMQTTPSIMNFHLDNISNPSNLHSLKYIVLAGEQLPKKLVNRIHSIVPDCTVYNGYGPSETTIFSTTMDVTKLEKICIGKPIGNTQIYILNKNKKLLPKNNMGEIYISGDGVGRGYLYKENMTKEKYTNNPFIKNSIMYETGDLGIWQSNGTIECKGRIDHQIKLNGLRIEFGEIEERINSFKTDNLLKSAVVVKNIAEKDTLNAFISYPGQINLSELKKYLLEHLPNYMIPNTYTIIDKLPMTPNGKIDRKSLNNYEINTEETNTKIVGPRNQTEKIILNVIKKKLNINEFGIDNNIFDYGADSLTIINIITELFEYKLDLKVYDMYKYPTIREMCENLLHKKEKPDNSTTDFNKINKLVDNFTKGTNTSCTNNKYNILLTGSTGFLGSHILSTLLDNPEKIGTIYCAIREKNNIANKKRLLQKMNFYFNDKYDNIFDKYIKIVNCEISQEKLGLSTDKYENLQKNVDIVIHSAANVKHYGKYTEFEKSNIGSTKNIIDFCIGNNIHLHYMSTMTVSGNYLLKQNNDFIFNENSFYNNQNFDENVYSKSKLLSESVIIEHIEKGLNATIYRIGDLTGRYEDGVFQENINENSIYLRLKSILEIGAISNTISKNDLEFSPVDVVATAIKTIIWSDNNKNRIFNVYNPNMITTEKLLNTIAKFNYHVSALEKEDFANLIKELSKDEKNQKKIMGIINDFTEDNDLVYNYTIKQENTITCEYLNNLGFKWPNIDEKYIEKIINYMKKVNFIK